MNSSGAGEEGRKEKGRGREERKKKKKKERKKKGERKIPWIFSNFLISDFIPSLFLYKVIIDFDFNYYEYLNCLQFVNLNQRLKNLKLSHR